MGLTEQDPSEKKSRKAISAGSSVKRSSRKKAKDKPKRPLSAYNYFFKTERQRILKYLGRKGDQNTESNEEEEEVVSAEEESRLVTESGKVSFEEMGKLIGRRWKAITPENLESYNKLAALDAERYKKELADYNEKKEKGAMHEAQRNAMLHMQGQGPGGRPDYYPPPPYHGGPNGPSSMSMYGAPYSNGMSAPPYMGGPMYPGHYGGGYADYNPNGGYSSGRGSGDSSYPPSGPPQHPHAQSHHPSPGGPGSSYPSGSMDPYGGGVSEYPGPPGDPQGHPGPQLGGYGGSSGGYPSQQYGGHGSYPAPNPYPGAPQDQHPGSSQGGHQRWG